MSTKERLVKYCYLVDSTRCIEECLSRHAISVEHHEPVVDAVQPELLAHVADH